MTADKRDTQYAGGPGATLSDVLTLLKRGIEMDIRVSAPASIVTYNPTLQTAVLLLGYLPVVSDNTGVEIPTPPITLYDVPVAFPRTAAGYITFPIVPNDTGMLVFSDRALTQWLAVGAPVDPIQGRTHSIADGVFFPGLHATANPITPPTSLTATVVEGPVIQLGATAVPAVNNVALAQSLHTYLVAAITAAPVAVLDGGASFKAGLLAYMASNPYTTFATTKTLAE